MNKPKGRARRDGVGESKCIPPKSSKVVSRGPDQADDKEYSDWKVQTELEMLVDPPSQLLIMAETMRGRQEVREALRGIRLAPSSLSPDRHPQRKFFVADLFGVPFKDDLASMEHPLFALQAGDKRIREYQHNGVTVAVLPGYHGCATIHDKDLWIYCISQLVRAMDQGREDVARTVRFTAYDFLVTTNRKTSGHAYDLLKKALRRLKATVIQTNLKTDKAEREKGFGLIEDYDIVEKDPKSERMVALEVTLPDWLYRAVQSRSVLTLDPEYFRIRRPLDRRLYELARKHAGDQAKWQCGLRTLHEKSGSAATLYKFRESFRELVAANNLPGYRVVYDAEKDQATFYSRRGHGARIQLQDVVRAVTVEATKKSK